MTNIWKQLEIRMNGYVKNKKLEYTELCLYMSAFRSPGYLLNAPIFWVMGKIEDEM